MILEDCGHNNPFGWLFVRFSCQISLNSSTYVVTCTMHSSSSVVITKKAWWHNKALRKHRTGKSPNCQKGPFLFLLLLLYSPRTISYVICDMMPKCMYSFTYKDSSMIQHSDVHISWLRFCLFRYLLERSNSAKLTLKRAKDQFPIEVSTA